MSVSNQNLKQAGNSWAQIGGKDSLHTAGSSPSAWPIPKQKGQSCKELGGERGRRRRRRDTFASAPSIASDDFLGVPGRVVVVSQ